MRSTRASAAIARLNRRSEGRNYLMAVTGSGLFQLRERVDGQDKDISEALPDFLRFCGDRPLVAHNADFDVGFLTAACERLKLPFEPIYIDTLVLAQNLLPHLSKHKLDIVAEHLDLPAFNHHRAADDAAMVGYMLIPFFERMEREMDIHRLQQINGEMLKLRPSGGTASRPP